MPEPGSNKTHRRRLKSLLSNPLKRLLTSILLGLGLKLLTAQANTLTAFAAGVIAGLGMWVGVEGLIGVTMILGLLGFMWFWDRGEFARYGFVFSVTISAMAALVILVEHPPTLWLAAQYDILSIVHLFVFVMITVFAIFARRQP